jgi:hypothetical protein
MPVIFFDIGQTLATARLDAHGRLIGFTVLPGVLGALAALQARELRMGIISDRGDIPRPTVIQELDRSGLLNFFDQQVIIFEEKKSPAPFKTAANTAGVSPSECYFVGENNQERSHALTAGFAKAIPDPSLVIDVLDGAELFFASISPPDQTDAENDVWSTAFSNPALIPLRISNNPLRAEVLTTTAMLDRMDDLGFDIQTLGKENDPETKDLYLVRDDRSMPEGLVDSEAFSTSFLAEQGFEDLVVGSADEGLFIALPGGVAIEELHFPDARHGHNDRLIPDKSLLASLKNNSASANLVSSSALAEVFDAAALAALHGITPAVIQQLHERYIGVAISSTPTTNA